MARIKSLNYTNARIDAKLDASKTHLKQNVSLRFEPWWLDFLNKKSKEISEKKKERICMSDLVREAVYQFWIKDSKNGE